MNDSEIVIVAKNFSGCVLDRINAFERMIEREDFSAVKFIMQERVYELRCALDNLNRSIANIEPVLDVHPPDV